MAYASAQVTGGPIYLVSSCSSGEEFVAAFRRYADRHGLFVPIAEPIPAGRRGRFAVALARGGVMIEGEAEVVSSSPSPSVLHGRVGMTLRFVDPDPASRTVLAELEKARLAMRPQPPSVPPRPAAIPDAPRAVPPAPAGRIDATNALAECVAIGDLDALEIVEPASPPPKAGPRFVAPSQASGGRPARLAPVASGGALASPAPHARGAGSPEPERAPPRRRPPSAPDPLAATAAMPAIQPSPAAPSPAAPQPAPAPAPSLAVGASPRTAIDRLREIAADGPSDPAAPAARESGERLDLGDLEEVRDADLARARHAAEIAAASAPTQEGPTLVSGVDPRVAREAIAPTQRAIEIPQEPTAIHVAPPPPPRPTAATPPPLPALGRRAAASTPPPVPVVARAAALPALGAPSGSPASFAPEIALEQTSHGVPPPPPPPEAPGAPASGERAPARHHAAQPPASAPPAAPPRPAISRALELEIPGEPTDLSAAPLDPAELARGAAGAARSAETGAREPAVEGADAARGEREDDSEEDASAADAPGPEPRRTAVGMAVSGPLSGARGRPTIEEPTPSGDWTIVPGADAPTLLPRTAPRRHDQDWTIPLGGAADDGWTTPTPSPARGGDRGAGASPDRGDPRRAVVASAEPIEAEPRRPSDAEIAPSEPKVQIDPTLIEPLIPLGSPEPRYDALADDLGATAAPDAAHLGMAATVPSTPVIQRGAAHRAGPTPAPALAGAHALGAAPPLAAPAAALVPLAGAVPYAPPFPAAVGSAFDGVHALGPARAPSALVATPRASRRRRVLVIVLSAGLVLALGAISLAVMSASSGSGMRAEPSSPASPPGSASPERSGLVSAGDASTADAPRHAPDGGPGSGAPPASPRAPTPVEPTGSAAAAPSPAPLQREAPSDPAAGPPPGAAPDRVAAADRPPAEPAASARCTFDVGSTPSGAEIWLGGAALGTTPRRLSLPCNTEVRLAFRKARYATVERRYTPTATGRPLRVALARPTATVAVRSSPPGATILVGGRVQGVTPTTVRLPIGEAATLTLSKDGYADGTLTVTPKPGAAAVVTAKLKRRAAR